MLVLAASALAFGREARLVRYPHYHNGPAIGVFLADSNRTNMENYGVQPDMLVDNTPEDNLAGRDRQLETAVEELLKQLQSPRKNLARTE